MLQEHVDASEPPEEPICGFCHGIGELYCVDACHVEECPYCQGDGKYHL